MVNRLLLVAATALAATALAPVSASAAVPVSPGFPPAVGGPGRARTLDLTDCAAVASSNSGHHHRRHHRRVRMVFNQAIANNSTLTVCLDPHGQPATYLNLRSGQNFSRYAAGGASQGTDVTTWYTKLRIDPVPVRTWPLTFRANIADQTFTRSTGLLCHGGALLGCAPGSLVHSMPYGVAFSCDNAASGSAGLDLRGTPFAPVNGFALGGFHPVGTTHATGSQRLDLTGGGYCGWNAPGSQFNPYNDSPSTDTNHGWDLQLRIAGF